MRMSRLHFFCVFLVPLWIPLLPILNAETLRVATFNVHNYLNMDRRVEGYWREDYPKPESEKTALREIILRIRPDILALQEIGGPAYLEELQNDLKMQGLDYHYAALMDGPDEARHLALLSRIAPKQVLTHDQIDFKYFDERLPIKRGLMEIVFETSGVRWHLFNVHLKSRWTDREDDPKSALRRVREAQAIRDFLRERLPPGAKDSRYLIVGDFNDARDSATIQRFLKVSDTELARLVPCVDSRGEAWTFHYRRRDLYERVDFILASPPMWAFVRGGTGSVVDIWPESTIASDHRMVTVDLDFPEYPLVRE